MLLKLIMYCIINLISNLTLCFWTNDSKYFFTCSVPSAATVSHLFVKLCIVSWIAVKLIKKNMSPNSETHVL